MVIKIDIAVNEIDYFLTTLREEIFEDSRFLLKLRFSPL